MKNLKTIATIVFLTLASSVSFSQALPSLLGTGKIGFCPGVGPQVLNVETLAVDLPGGSNGNKLLWHEGEKFPPILGSRLNLRQMLNRSIGAYDYASLDYDASFTQALAQEIRVAGAIALDGATISACISKFDFANVVQNSSVQTQAVVDLGYKIYVTTGEGPTKRTLLVQELAGRTVATSEYFYILVVEDVRTRTLIPNTWNVIRGTFPNFLKDTSSAEAIEGMRILRNDLGDFVDLGNR